MTENNLLVQDGSRVAIRERGSVARYPRCYRTNCQEAPSTDAKILLVY
jgi:hypothetical protein